MHGGNPSLSIDITTALSAAGGVEQQKRLIGKWLDKDRATARAFWDYVQECGGLAIGDWKFVADSAQATAVLQDHAAFSVAEYNERMRATSGRFFLGMDGTEHDRDAKLGEIIPSWNRFNQPSYPDPDALRDVHDTAAAVTCSVLAGLARRTEIARLTYAQAECQVKSIELFGPVLDACAARFFGVPGHSAYSLFAWAKDVTWFHFRVYADKQVDQSPAEHASAQYRQHVLSLIAALPPEPRSGEEEDLPADVKRLREVVSKLRQLLGQDARDEDVARNLIGIMTGSLTATFKAFIEALLVQARQLGSDRIAWPEVAPSANPAASGCPYAQAHALPSFPHYDALIATPLARAKRGSLDTVYRKYQGTSETMLGNLTVVPKDLVIVWLGGTLDPAKPEQQDNLFGIGVHKCPGMDMGKAILNGVMSVLSQVRGIDAPRRRAMEGDLALVFDNVAALKTLKPGSLV